MGAIERICNLDKDISVKGVLFVGKRSSMQDGLTQQEMVLPIFDSFCKTVLRNRVRELTRNQRRRSKREYTAQKTTEEMSYADQYPSDEQRIVVAELFCYIKK